MDAAKRMPHCRKNVSHSNSPAEFPPPKNSMIPETDAFRWGGIGLAKPALKRMLSVSSISRREGSGNGADLFVMRHACPAPWGSP